MDRNKFFIVFIVGIAIFFVFTSKGNYKPSQLKRFSLADTRKIIKEWGEKGFWSKIDQDICPPLFHSSPDFVTELGDLCLNFPSHPIYRTGCGADVDRSVLDYQWQTSSQITLSDSSKIPRIPDWDQLRVCSLLLDKFVVVIGDSLSGTFFFTLNSALKDPQYVSENQEFLTESVAWPLCKVCSFTGEHFVRLRFMVLTLPPSEPGVGLLPEFLEVMNEAFNLGYEPQNIIFVVNWGHWFIRGEPFVADNILKRILWGLKLLRNVANESIIFWRTSPGGHPDAHFDVGLKDSPPLDAPLNQSFYFDGPLSNSITAGWWVLEEFQPILSAAILIQDPDIFILDVVPATKLRHDSHPNFHDGLHYCVPGPVDFWVRYFISSLELIYHSAEFNPYHSAN